MALEMSGLRMLLAGAALAGLGISANAETFVEHSAEARMQLDFVVPDAALKNSCRQDSSPMSRHRARPRTATCA